MGSKFIIINWVYHFLEVNKVKYLKTDQMKK